MIFWWFALWGLEILEVLEHFWRMFCLSFAMSALRPQLAKTVIWANLSIGLSGAEVATESEHRKECQFFCSPWSADERGWTLWLSNSCWYVASRGLEWLMRPPPLWGNHGEPADRFRSFLSAPNGWNFKEGHSSVALVGCMDPGHTLTIHENLKDYCMKTNLWNSPGKFLYKMLRDGVSENYE